MRDHSTMILEPEQPEPYALRCIINQAAAISISKEAEESSFKSNYKTSEPAFLFFVKLYDEYVLQNIALTKVQTK